MKLTFTHLTDSEGYECECCGSGYGEGFVVYVNDVEVYREEHDGHMGGFVYPEDKSFISCILDEMLNQSLLSIEDEYTEEKRIEWNAKYCGAYISSAPEIWKEEMGRYISIFKSGFECIKECVNACPHITKENTLKLIQIYWDEYMGEYLDIEHSYAPMYGEQDNE